MMETLRSGEDSRPAFRSPRPRASLCPAGRGGPLSHWGLLVHRLSPAVLSVPSVQCGAELHAVTRLGAPSLQHIPASAASCAQGATPGAPEAPVCHGMAHALESYLGEPRLCTGQNTEMKDKGPIPTHEIGELPKAVTALSRP